MRTTIDPKLNLAANQVKRVKKASAESSSSFDDALKAVKPNAKERRADETKPAEPKKIEPKRKPQKPEAAEEAPPEDKSEETTEAMESIDVSDESGSDMPAEDESTGDDTQKPAAAKDETDPQVKQEDSIEIAALVAVQPQPVQATESVETSKEPRATDAVESQPLQKNITQQAKPQPVQPVSQEGPSQETAETAEDSVSPLQAQSTDAQQPVKESKVDVEKRGAAQASEKSMERAQANEVASAIEKTPAPVESTALPTPPPSHQVQAAPLKTPEPQSPQHAGQAQDLRFADDNHPRIVTGIRGELLPDGGKMTLKLDPPELGALQVQVHMQDGAMTATFQTTNDDATRLLSHSLATLKNSLESQGISVEKLQVQQAPRDQQTSTGQDQREQQQSQWDNPSAKQEQQRHEMLQRMWRKLAGAEDPLDLVA